MIKRNTRRYRRGELFSFRSFVCFQLNAPFDFLSLSSSNRIESHQNSTKNVIICVNPQLANSLVFMICDLALQPSVEIKLLERLSFICRQLHSSVFCSRIFSKRPKPTKFMCSFRLNHFPTLFTISTLHSILNRMNIAFISG